MSLTPAEQKLVLELAKDDASPRNQARRILVAAYEQMAAAIAQQLPPWDRRWLEFDAVDAIAAAYFAGDTEDGDPADDGRAADGDNLGRTDGRTEPEVHSALDADPGEGGAAA